MESPSSGEMMDVARGEQYVAAVRAIWWIKRDIRLDDNAALAGALGDVGGVGGEVVPLWVVEPSLVAAADSGLLHYRMVLPAVRHLKSALEDRGCGLMVRIGEITDVLDRLRRECPFGSIHAEEETGTELTYRRDRMVRAWCRDRGIAFTEHPHGAVVRPLRSREKRMDRWRERMHQPPTAAPRQIPMSESTRRVVTPASVPSIEMIAGIRISTANGQRSRTADRTDVAGIGSSRRCKSSLQQSSEQGWRPVSRAVQRCDEPSARITLHSFLEERSIDYRRGISSPARSRHTGSRLSVHLAWGTISMRRVFHELWQREAELRSSRESGGEAARTVRGRLSPLSAFGSRLFWHDHFCQRLEDEPTMERVALNRAYEDLEYGGEAHLEALLAGRTGYPLVDATVRALTESGFVNFRMRAMLVSFACHVLHIDWRHLRDPMARIMADYLPGIHLSQLQMQAGVVGINTIRIYNPTKQLLEHDPECTFVKRFLPELRAVAPERIRAWSVATCDTSRVRAADRNLTAELFPDLDEMRLTSDYPRPIVAYRQQAAVMRARLAAIRRSPVGRAEAARVLSRHGSRLRRR